MKSGAAPLAKLRRPRLHAATSREQLFARLDALRKQPLIWVSGPPGAGKTTLLASYLEARAIEGLWYQLDAGDLDLSTYFFYLGTAAKKLVGDTAPLPLLTQDYAHDPSGFARRWFRQLFSRLEPPTLLVFDNYQEVAESALGNLLAAAIQDVPEGITLVIISRTTPSPAFARALAHGDIAVLGWDELRLRQEEAEALAAARGVSSRETVRTVLAQCEGWAAGCAVMLDRLRESGGAAGGADLDSKETIFGYFTGLVFDALPEAARRHLVLCSYLPTVSTTQAQALTGDPEASRLLDQLYRRHLFTNRRTGSDDVYEFHALFRAFLRAQATQILSQEQREHALKDAASLLLAAGQGFEAVALLAEIRDWAAIETLILAHAPTLLAQGRAQTLCDWLAILPGERLHEAPWLQYWLGTALVASDQQRARGTLTLAYERLTKVDDFAGQVAAAAGVVETYFFSFSGYSGLAEWTPKLARLLEQDERFSSAEQRLQACSGYLLAAFFTDGAHPHLARYTAEIKRLLREPIDLNLRLRAGTFLVSYAGAIMDPALVRDDLELLDAMAKDPRAAPMRRAQWQIRYASLVYQLGDFDLAEARLATAERLCSEHGLRTPGSLLNQITMFVLTGKGDVQRAVALVERWETTLSPDRPVERSQFNVGRLITLVASETRKSEWPTIAREIAEQMDATGQTWIRVANRIPGAYALTACGEYDSARQWVEDLRALIAGTCFVRYERDALLIEANLALHEGEPELARDRLRRALQWTRQAEIPLLYAQNPLVFDRLLRFASQEDVEPDAARALAARYGRALDRADATLHSPRIRVVTFGHFELEIDGRTLPSKGKTQQRLLSLLKVLASQGRRGAAVSLITEALWPDSEGDKSANALKVAVHRLRKLLGDESAVRTVRGSIFLDEQLCWTDVGEFENLTDQAERHRGANQMDAFERAANAALALYQGPFLASEDALPWLVGARDRLSQKARQLVLALGLHVEAAGDATRACRLYESGLAIDALYEPLYQRLMSAHLRAGRNAEAMQAFRRCREMLSIVLGIQPSAETRALFEEARARGAASVTGR